MSTLEQLGDLTAEEVNIYQSWALATTRHCPNWKESFVCFLFLETKHLTNETKLQRRTKKHCSFHIKIVAFFQKICKYLFLLLQSTIAKKKIMKWKNIKTFFCGPPKWANWFLTWSIKRKTNVFCFFLQFLASNKRKENIPPGAGLQNVCDKNLFCPF